MRRGFIYLLLVFSTSSTIGASGSVFANVKIAHVENTPSLSLCNLMKDVRRYNGRLMRVRVVILGTGGHYPFFITGQDCDPERVVALWIRFEHWDRTKAIFEKRLFDVLGCNLARERPKAAVMIIGRVSNHGSGRSPRLLLSVTNVEVEGPYQSSSRRTSPLRRP